MGEKRVSMRACCREMGSRQRYTLEEFGIPMHFTPDRFFLIAFEIFLLILFILFFTRKYSSVKSAKQRTIGFR